MRALQAGALLATVAAAPVALAEEWDDPKPPEQLGMRSDWFKPEPSAPIPAPITPAPVPVPVPVPVSPAPSWTGDDSAFNPNGPDSAARPGGGKLDQQLIKDAIQPHLGEVKFCFAREQAQNPELSGRVVIKFTIGESGAVTQSAVESSSVDNAAVERCVAAAVRRWTFPTPKGGSVVVTWPFKVMTMR